MIKQSLVSIIIPAYNCERHIAEAINSALDQDYPDKEIIIVDDGSTDQTINILKQYGEEIKVITQKNAGAAVARNTGINASSGEFIAFLDSDDLWLPHKLTIQVGYMQANPEIGLVYTDWMVWSADKDGNYVLPEIPEISTDKYKIDKDNSGWLFNRLFDDCSVHTTTVIMRREVVSQAGLFDTELRKGQDYEYWFRISRYTEFHKLDTVLSLYRMNPQSVTNNPSQVNYGFLVMQKVLDKWGRVGPDGTITSKKVIRDRLARIWEGFAYLHYTSGDAKLAFHAFLSAIRNKPYRINYWFYAVLSLFKWIKIT